MVLRGRKHNITTGAPSNLANQKLYGAAPWTYWLKQALVSAGWVVYYSSDGTSSGSSDLWTSYDFQKVAFTQYTNSSSTSTTIDGIWCCLRSPTTDANGDYLHICLVPSNSLIGDARVVPSTLAAGYNLSAVGVYATAGSNHFWEDGSTTGFLRIGMTLSSSLSAFSGGAPSSSSSLAAAAGLLPSAVGEVWSVRNIGCGASYQIFTSITVLTEGNQFLVVLQPSNSTYSAGQNYFFGIASMDNGGYATFNKMVPYSTATAATLGGMSSYQAGLTLEQGHLGEESRGLSYASGYTTLLTRGGYRATYVKRINGVVSSGAAGFPMTSWRSLPDVIPTISSYVAHPYFMKMRVYSLPVDGTPSVDLGDLGDILLLGTYQPVSAVLLNGLYNDQSLLVDNSQPAIWWVSWNGAANNQVFALKWSMDDNPLKQRLVDIV